VYEWKRRENLGVVKELEEPQKNKRKGKVYSKATGMLRVKKRNSWVSSWLCNSF